MLRSIKRFYDKKIASPETGVTAKKATDHAVKLATAALLVEITRADSEVKEVELEAVARALERKFDLAPDDIAELIELATLEADGAVSFYEFTTLINKGFSYDQKKEVVSLLWEVVFSDDEMEKHEEHYVRKIADLLHVSHRDFIETRERARSSK